MTTAIRTTHAGTYVELDPDKAIRVTHAGAYVELDPDKAIRVTHVGVYVEMKVPAPRGPKVQMI